MSKAPFPVFQLAGALGVVQALRIAERRRNALDLRGKTVAVTGGSSGLGLAMARECARQGANIAICARDGDQLERARVDLEALGVDVHAVRADLANPADAERFVSETVDRFGGLDVLFCNAGVISVAEFEALDDQRFRDAMEIMFFGTLATIRAAVPHLKNSGAGRIAITSSIGGRLAMPYMVPYATAKGALDMLAQGLRAELKPSGISVTAIVPGLMRTGSYVNAEFTGDQQGRELGYRTFSTLASVPFVTGDGEAAANVFVEAVRRGEVEVMYPPIYQAISRAHGLAPTLTTEILGVIRRLMPSLGDDSTNLEGRQIEASMDAGPVWKAATTMGRDAGERMLNEDAVAKKSDD